MQQQAGPGFWFACLPVPVLIKKKNLAMGRTIDRSRVRMINHETHGRVEKGTKTGLPYETCRNIAVSSATTVSMRKSHVSATKFGRFLGGRFRFRNRAFRCQVVSRKLLLLPVLPLLSIVVVPTS